MNNTISEIRSKNYIKQIKGSFIFKGLAIFASFLSIPLMIKYLGVENYGVWSTLLSIVSWIVLFDIGIGNGLRNKISESLAKDNTQEAHKYISTAYTIIGAISVILTLIFLLVSDYIAWQKVFNIIYISNQDLKSVVNITAIFLFLNFWISLINQVFNGFQKTSLVIFNQFLSNTFSLSAVFILYNFYETSLVKLSLFYGLSVLSSSLILTIYFYQKNRFFIPRFRFFSIRRMTSITSVGFQFFVIQIAAIVIFATDKIVITQLFGPEYIVSYDIVFKLFSFITIAYSLITGPLWAAYSDAYHNEDWKWIEQTIKKQLKIYTFIVLCTFVLALFSEYIIYFWIREDLGVNKKLIYSMVLFILITTWNSIFSTFVNALGMLNVQIITSILAILLNIPISIFMVKYFDMGTYGVVIGTVFSLSLFGLFGSIQVYRLIKIKI